MALNFLLSTVCKQCLAKRVCLLHMFTPWHHLAAGSHYCSVSECLQWRLDKQGAVPPSSPFLYSMFFGSRGASPFWYQNLQIQEVCRFFHKLCTLVKPSWIWFLSSWAQSETGCRRGCAVCMHEQLTVGLQICVCTVYVCLCMNARGTALPYLGAVVFVTENRW